MQVENRQGPAFGVARITMGPNERIRAESGAMMATTPTVAVVAKAEGGVLKSLKRAALGNPAEFLGFISAAVGTGNSGPGGASGAIGGLLGRD